MFSWVLLPCETANSERGMIFLLIIFINLDFFICLINFIDFKK
jgi:hypothetical protein